MRSLLATDTGTAFVDECLDRHVSGEWGAVSPTRWASNHRHASNEALADGKAVVGMYHVPIRVFAGSWWLITFTEGVELPTHPSLPIEVRMAVTWLLLLSEPELL